MGGGVSGGGEEPNQTTARKGLALYKSFNTLIETIKQCNEYISFKTDFFHMQGCAGAALVKVKERDICTVGISSAYPF